MTYETLYQAYIVDKKSTYQIAKEFQLGQSVINRLLIKYNIPRRSKAEAQSLYLKNTNNHPTKDTQRPDSVKKAIGQKTIKRWEEVSEEIKQEFKERGKRVYEQHGVNLKNKGLASVRASSKKGSKLEHFIDNFLTTKGYKVEPHKNMLTNEKLHVDMYLPDEKVVIEINGPSHYLPIRGEDKLKKQQKADYDKRGLITSAGFVYIIIKNLNKYSFVRYTKVCEELLGVLKGDNLKSLTQRFVELEV